MRASFGIFVRVRCAVSQVLPGGILIPFRRLVDKENRFHITPDKGRTDSMPILIKDQQAWFRVKYQFFVKKLIPRVQLETKPT